MIFEELFGKTIQEKRKAQGFTQQDLADMINVSKRTIQNAESGKAITFVTGLRLIDTLQIDVSQFREALYKEFRFIPIPGTCLDEDGNLHPSYGISVEEFINSEWVTTSHIDDVSLNIREVRDLAMRCNKYKLQPIHLRDIIEDHIGT